MDRETRDKIRSAMEAVARKNQISLETMNELIQLQIQRGLKSQNPAVRALWRRIPSDDVQPTPEEAVGYLAAVRMGLIDM